MTQTNSPSGRAGDDAPEWIFATGDGANGSWTVRKMPEVWGAAVTKYLRADLEATASLSIATQPDLLADPRVRALVEAAIRSATLMERHGLSGGLVADLKAALAAFDTTDKPQGANNEVKGGKDE